MAYPYTVLDLLAGIGATQASPTGGVWAKLSQRQDVMAYGAQWIADTVLEYSQSYPFQGLQRSTTTPVQLTGGVYQYPFSTFVNTGDIPTPVNQYNANPKLIPSFFMFYDNPLNPVTGYNPGIGLTYKSIDSMELMFSTPGTPAYWTRYQNQIFIAPQPIQNFFAYMRYQIQHPFSQPAALTDVIELDDDWRELIEYGAAMRGAINLRMLDYASQYHNVLFGDPKKKGDLGMLTARVSQQENDIVSNQGMKQIRPMNWRR
jgi:hypothetical protein